MDSNPLSDLFQDAQTEVDAGELRGRVRLVSPSQLWEYVRRREESVRAEVRKEAIGPGDVPDLLDSYMSENADLKARNEAFALRVREYEEKLAALEAGGGGGGGLPLAPYLSFDADGVVAAVESLSENLGNLESALNDVENMEESWVFIEKIAAIRAEVNRLVEETEEAGSVFAALHEQPEPPAGDLVANVRRLSCVQAEARAYDKVVDFVRSILGLDE